MVTTLCPTCVIVFPSISVERDTVYSVPWTNPSNLVLYLYVVSEEEEEDGGGGDNGGGGGVLGDDGGDGDDGTMGFMWSPAVAAVRVEMVEGARWKLTLRLG